MTKQNLANLPDEIKAEIDLHKRVCYARNMCRGKSKKWRSDFILTLDHDVQEEIKKLTLLRAKA